MVVRSNVMVVERVVTWLLGGVVVGGLMFVVGKVVVVIGRIGWWSGRVRVVGVGKKGRDVDKRDRCGSRGGRGVPGKTGYEEGCALQGGS